MQKFFAIIMTNKLFWFKHKLSVMKIQRNVISSSKKNDLCSIFPIIIKNVNILLGNLGKISLAIMEVLALGNEYKMQIPNCKSKG